MSSAAHAQDAQATSDIPFTPQQMSELKKWLSDDADWEKWFDRWGNQVLSHPVRHRPAPPVWLANECAQLIEGDGLLARACSRLKDISEGYAAARIRKTMAAQRQQQEGSKTRFIERVHVGAGWPLMQLDGLKYGALLESHVTVAHRGRAELNLPGIMILSMPDQYGNRVLTFGTDITLGVRLGDFRMPGRSQWYVLHLNIANAWTDINVGGFGFENRTSLIGLSVTIKKN